MPQTQLLLFSDEVEAGPTRVTRFGGLPSVGSNFAWPHCASCGGAMQFLGQLGQPEVSQLMLIFLCQNDPGACDDWNAIGGANAVIIVEDEDLRLAQPPEQGVVIRDICHGARSYVVEAEDYWSASEKWLEDHMGRNRDILGKLGGEPDWVQSDETPYCDRCRSRMTFVAMLEEGPEGAAAMNFGFGSAYIFACECRHPLLAKFLWQC